MAFIGNTPTTQSFTPAVDYFSGNGSTTAFTLSRPVASVAQVQVVVNNVAQNPGSSYTVSANTITFSAAPSSGTANIYVYYTSPITQVQGLTQAPAVIGPMSVSINGATGIGGATNPIVNMSGAANNYVQGYVNNTTNGVNSSADLVAYPSNGTDASGWVDVGITSPSYSQAAFSVTGPNEAYLFGSAPAGSGTTGNMVYATDSTGTSNTHQFYAGGFNQAKSAVKFSVSPAGAYGQLISGTAQASTSGTSIDFTGIPSWVKRVTVMFNGVSTNGSSIVQIQIGSGSVSTTGYTSAAGYTYSTGGSLTSSSTSGFALCGNADPSLVFSGSIILTLLGSNTWTSSGVLINAVGTATCSASSGVSPALGGALDRVRITTIAGTNTFDAGSINILYEG